MTEKQRNIIEGMNLLLQKLNKIRRRHIAGSPRDNQNI